MDFIERWFGVSPDGGDGTLELLYLGVGLLILAAFVWHRWRRKSHSRPSQ
jgi:MYXO-CTERM domain-containing protein